MLYVEGPVREQSDRVNIPGEHQLFERVVSPGAIVHLHQSLPPILAQITNGLHNAIRMLVPLKRSPETTPDNTNANLLRGGVDRYRALWKRHGARKGITGLL